MKKIAILQSNYIPWKGYFDMIHMVDEFILYDDMQYTKRDWRNRNKIKTCDGIKWLTIPVVSKGKFYQKINETEVMDNEWIDVHMKSLEYNYKKAPYYKVYRDQIFSIYEQCREEKLLSNINYKFITEICRILGIHTKIVSSSEYSLVEGKTERLVGLCKSAKANAYLSGPAAKDYIVDELFEEACIKLEYMNYSGYPEYKQLFGEFDHAVTILDLIFNTGPYANAYMKSFGEEMKKI